MGTEVIDLPILGKKRKDDLILVLAVCRTGSSNNHQNVHALNPDLMTWNFGYCSESNTFFDTKFFRYRIRNYQKYGKVVKPRTFETGTAPKI